MEHQKIFATNLFLIDEFIFNNKATSRPKNTCKNVDVITNTRLKMRIPIEFGL